MRLTVVKAVFLLYYVIRISSESNPTLTTIRQDAVLRAKTAIECIEAMRDGRNCEAGIVLPVELIKRESTRELSCQSL